MGSTQTWKRLLAEFIGTFLLIVIGAGVVAYAARYLPGVNNTLITALAFGGVMAFIVYVFGKISGGHVNPAVSLGFALTGRMSWGLMIGYWIAQLLGALAGAGILYYIFGRESGAGMSTGVFVGIDNWKAVLIETLLTFMLVFGFLYISKQWQSSLLAGVVVGTIVAFNFMFAGPLTGGSANPARSFGPAAVIGNFSSFWVFLLGPLIGAILASIVYSIITVSAWKPALTEDGKEVRDKCCRRILEKEVPMLDNCGNPVIDTCTGKPVFYKKHKIEIKNKDTFTTSHNHLKDKMKEHGDSGNDMFSHHTIEDFKGVGPVSDAHGSQLESYKDKLSEMGLIKDEKFQFIDFALLIDKLALGSAVTSSIEVQQEDIFTEKKVAFTGDTEGGLESQDVFRETQEVREVDVTSTPSRVTRSNTLNGNGLNGNGINDVTRSTNKPIFTSTKTQLNDVNLNATKAQDFSPAKFSMSTADMNSSTTAGRTVFQSPTSLSRAISGSRLTVN